MTATTTGEGSADPSGNLPADDGKPEAGAIESLGEVSSADARVRTTARWKGVSTFALVTGAAGILFSRSALLLSSVVGIVYLAYARATARPNVSLSVSREFDDTDPAPGDEVGVTVTVTNEGDSTLWDLRLVDGVPDPLPVVEGTPRGATTLRPGRSTTLEYVVRAKRGDHEFEPTLALARDLSGSVEREAKVVTDDALVCTPTARATREVPLRMATTPFTGRVETDEGGEGVEFHALREYRTGDSLNRIDWHRKARTGELATILFRQERAASVMLVMDLREAAYVREDEEGLHAADCGVEAASRVFSALLESGERVGLASVATEDLWLRPGTGNEHWARARDLFTSHPSLASTVPQARTPVTLEVRRLRKRLPPNTQVVLFSPLCDDGVVRGARLLEAHGHLVTVVSPDPTAGETPGQQLARTERAARMADLRRSGIRVIDWDPDEHLATAIDRASRRWSA